MTMEKTRSSPFSFLFPWLSPLEIKFALVDGGIDVQLYKNNRLLKNWHPSQLHHVLPLPLTKWIEDHHVHMAPQPYPLIKQLWQYLTPHVSKKLIIDASVLAELEEVSQPPNFALAWMVNHASAHIEGRYEGADRYLGMGWFHKGTKLWSLRDAPSIAADYQLRNLIVPIEQADSFLKLSIPYLQRYLPTHVTFQLITNFVVRVVVSDVRNGGLTLALECNYPQFLPIIQIPQQKIDVLLASHAIIRFPQQALTPVLIQLLRNNSSITIQGVGVPLFINEQLPTMRHFHQISDDMVAKIVQANPIVSIAMLRPTFSLIHTYENGVGKYAMSATYQYQHHTLDMSALLAGCRQNQRFLQQHAIWFEWPSNSHDLVNTILQQQATHVLRPEEVMGFDTQRVAFLQKQSTVLTIQPDGTTPIARSQSVFKQLRHHGIPGGIVGEPGGLISMFIEACRDVLGDYWQARILWLAPSNKKGSVTRTVNKSVVNSHVTVASLVTLRDEPALLSHSWTLVILQELDGLLDGSPQSMMLAQLKWQWALTSITSMNALRPSIMRALHLPEQYYERFCARYLFDLEKNYTNAVVGKSTASQHTAQPAIPIVPKKEAVPQATIMLVSTSTQPASPITPKKEEPARSVILPPPTSVVQKPHITQFNPETRQQSAQSLAQPAIHTPAKLTPENTRPKAAPSLIRHSIELNQKKIVKLHEESEQLQERLTVEDEESSAIETAKRAFPLSEVTSKPLKAGPESDKSASAPSVRQVAQPNQKGISKLQEEFERLRIKPTPAAAKVPAQIVPDKGQSTSAPTMQPAVQLNLEAISKLREEAEHLQGRLIVEAEEEQEQASISDPISAVPVVRAPLENSPEVDEDWQIILQQWKPEHWEIIRLLYQERADQLPEVERTVHRPLSRLIDEMNDPVAEQLDDALVDPETLTIFPHLHEVAEKLVCWYLSSQGR